MKPLHQTTHTSGTERAYPERSPWSAERVLLVCLLGVGLLGLAMTYGGRGAGSRSAAALPDSLKHSGRTQAMRPAATAQTVGRRVHQFEAADTVRFGLLPDSARL